jgi:hypothetical protein
VLSDKSTTFTTRYGQPDETNRGRRNRYVIHPRTIYNSKQSSGNIKKFRIFNSGEGKCRAAIVIINNKIDAIQIKQLTDGDTVVLELTIDKLSYFAVSMYMDIVEQMEKDLHKIDKILKFARGVGVIIAADTNSISTTWHDKQTNNRGRKLEEYISSKSLYIMNKESEMTIYKSRRGSSNLDLRIINNLLITACSGREISKEESCLDHNIINFCIAQGNPNRNAFNFNGIRYIVN